MIDQRASELLEQDLEYDFDTARFGIAELYGESFVDLSVAERLEFASFKPDKKARLKQAERFRLEVLRGQKKTGRIKPTYISRLEQLEEKRSIELLTNKICPFKSKLETSILCTKDGGVCSLRLYKRDESGNTIPVKGSRGGIRATCPNRFHEDEKIFKWASQEILESSTPTLVGEVGFLSSSQTVDSEEGEDVGRFDMILIDKSKPADYPLPWTALEIQAVYFSGKEMQTEFTGIINNIRDGGSGVIWPTENRRPDYRSSGPKRLMPQLQIKVPTLRRWGKKMTVVVDRSFYNSLGRMESVSEISNSDIAWLIVDFLPQPGTRRFGIMKSQIIYTTLEESVKGLTGGSAVPQAVFERKIREKL